MAGGHDYDHRLDLARSEKVIEDEAGAADGAPGLIAIAGSMQKVKNRELAFARFITGRGINMQAAKTRKRLGIIGNRSHGAVGHIPRVHEVRTRNANEAPDIVVGFADDRVARVDDCEA